MQLYKKISIEGFEKAQTNLLKLVNELFDYEELTTNIVVSKETIFERCPEIETFVVKNNLSWDVARFFITKPNDQTIIHNDGSSEYPKFLALNLPILNCENTLMSWWDDVEIVQINPNDIPSHTQKYGSYIEHFVSKSGTSFDSVELNSPSLVRINYPHNVSNTNNQFRIIFSIRFNPEPIHLWK